MMQHVDVTWVGLECRVRQEKGDEIYGTINSLSANGAHMSYKFPADVEFWNMGDLGERIVTTSVPVYSGPPMGLSLTATLVEYDSGDIDTYKRDVADAVAKVGSAAAAAATGGLSKVADQLIQDLSTFLVNIAGDILGVADDPYNPQSINLDLTTMTNPNRPRMVLTRDDDPHRVEYTDVIVLTGTDQGGDFGEYALYFDVRLVGAPEPNPDNPSELRPRKAPPATTFAVCPGSGIVEVFWVRPDGMVFTNGRDPNINGGKWNNPIPIAPNPESADPRSGVAAVCPAPGIVEVFWVRPDGMVFTNGRDPNINGGKWNNPINDVAPYVGSAGIRDIEAPEAA
jgi:hypothetical protein